MKNVTVLTTFLYSESGMHSGEATEALKKNLGTSQYRSYSLTLGSS